MVYSCSHISYNGGGDRNDEFRYLGFAPDHKNVIRASVMAFGYGGLCHSEECVRVKKQYEYVMGKSAGKSYRR